METKRYSFLELLSNIVDNRGKTCPVEESGLPLIATNCIKMDNLYPVFEKVRYVSNETHKNWFRGHPKPNDIIFVCKGAPGRVAWTPNPVNFCIAQDMLAIRANEKIINQKFLFALLRSKSTETKMLNMHVGTLIPHFKKGDFKNLFFDIPVNKEIQQYIGETYFELSNKIELNRKMNQTLEEMAQALFKSWFVDFDPVLDNALAAGNEIPEELQILAKKRSLVADDKKLLHTNPELAQLFPDSFVFNEVLGKWIPEGWEVKSIEKALVVNPKVSIKKGEIVKFTDMKALPTTGYSVDSVMEKEFKGGAKYNQGDVLLARITPCLQNGKTAIVDFLQEDECGFGSTEFIVLRGKGELKTPFTACLSRYDAFVNHCIQNMVGSSGRQRVMNSCFNSYFLSLPANRILKKFDELTRSLFSKITSNSNKIKSLTKLRDALLPQLISGNLRVPEVMLKKKSHEE